MLNETENQRLTEVGPGTSMGEFLRRYWHPVALVGDVSADRPTRPVRILGEDLVLFRDLNGRVGLIQDHCPHRGASLCYGRVEERGIACAYHGWLYDVDGNILETPPERNEAVMRHVKAVTYPVRSWSGLYWAFLGPLPVPELPRYDVGERTDGSRVVIVYPRLDCNWLQAMENSVDPAHLHILHQEFFRSHLESGDASGNPSRGGIDAVAKFDFVPFEFGIMKQRLYHNGYLEEHPVLFPNILREGNAIQVRVPIDDRHTWHVHVQFFPESLGRLHAPDQDPPAIQVYPYKDPPDGLHPHARFRLPEVLAQDHMAWETQGPIANRTGEHLGDSDRGVVFLRRLYAENRERVAAGLDPLAVVRDPGRGMIDTRLDESLREMQRIGRLQNQLEKVAQALAGESEWAEPISN